MSIKLNCKGRILSGTHAGWYVLIEKHEVGEGYSIYIADNVNFNDAAEGFDYWIENQANLKAQLEHEGWVIRWLDCPETTEIIN